MNVQAICNLIRHACEQELVNGHLRQLLNDQIERLHHTIDLPEENPIDTLHQFISDYIAHVPEFLETLFEASKEAGISCFINPFLAIAEENFLSPVYQGDLHTGLDALINKAYFAHRLIEEVNDSYMVQTGTALIPLNMTWANLIIHAILGEQFANKLDTVIEQSVKQIMSSQNVYDSGRFNTFTNERDPEQWINTWSRWKSLSLNATVDLKFTSTTS